MAHSLEKRSFVIILSGDHSDKALSSIESQTYEHFRVIDLGEEASRMTNLLVAIDQCEEDEIVVLLNQNGWLAHEWVLTTLNQYYGNSDLWLTYGSSCEYPTYHLGNASNLPFTFYAGLFKRIERSDLLSQEVFFPASLNLAILLPMMGMAEGHSQCVSEILYVVDGKQASSIDVELEARCEEMVRSLPAYAPLTTWKENI